MTLTNLAGNDNQGTGLVDEAIGKITQHIRTNELGPGDRLPSEAELVKQMKVSRTVVREAYRSLAAMRLINLAAGKRATVAPLDHGAMSLVIEHGVLTEQISIQQIYDVRRTIEMRTATLASLRRTDEEASTILRHAEEMAENVDRPEQVMELDLSFHLTIAKASRNPIFAIIVGAFQGVSRQSWPVGWRSRTEESQRALMLDTHRGIAEAIAAGNPVKASELMGIHFDESTKVLLAAGLS